MKKFSFTLQSVLNVKTIQEKQMKAEIARIQNKLNELFSKQAQLNEELEDSSLRYSREMQNGITVPQMMWYANFADYIQTQLKQLAVSIEETLRNKQTKQAELTALVKEKKTIEKLREEQYRVYLEEVAKEEEKILGDLISYNMTMETAD